MHKRTTVIALLMVFPLVMASIGNCSAYTLSGTYTLDGGTATVAS